MAAIIRNKGPFFSEAYSDICTLLVSRFKERTEEVKIEVFNTFAELCRATFVLSQQQSASSSADDMQVTDALSTFQSTLSAFVASIITNALDEYKKNELKVKSSVWVIVRELALCLPGSLSSKIDSLVPVLASALTEKDNVLRSSGLSCLHALLDTHPASLFSNHLDTISPALQQCVNEMYTKIKADGLRLCASFCKVVAQSAPQVSAANAALVRGIFNQVLRQLALQDVEQEVKDAAISSTALILTTLPDLFKDQEAQSLNIILDRLRNEVTRSSALSAIKILCSPSSTIDLSLILEPLAKELVSFLRKHSQALRNDSASTLVLLVSSHGAKLSPELVTLLLQESSPHLRDEDLQLAQSILDLLASIIRVSPACIPTFARDVFPKILVLLKSSLLQGPILNSLVSLFSALSAASNDSLKPSASSQSLISNISSELSKASLNAHAH